MRGRTVARDETTAGKLPWSKPRLCNLDIWPQVKRLDESWRKALGKELCKPYMRELWSFLQSEKDERKTVYPEDDAIFAALNATPLNEVKVVIIGQDPYFHGEADGLCFSVQQGVLLPETLVNIFQEINADMACGKRHSWEVTKGGKLVGRGCLEPWARQGVLLLNAVLTVACEHRKSHKGKGWEQFTNRIVEVVSQECENVAFLLWGKDAKKKRQLVCEHKHKVLEANHPSSKSAAKGFFGCRHFSRTNEYLSCRATPIDWFDVA